MALGGKESLTDVTCSRKESCCVHPKKVRNGCYYFFKKNKNTTHYMCVYIYIYYLLFYINENITFNTYSRFMEVVRTSRQNRIF